jgi:chorismate dehydratase
MVIRVGALQFINAYPLFFALHNRIIPNDVKIVWGGPVEIHNMLKNREVDVAMMSSVDFLDNRFSYILLSDLGLAATERIGSVRLFFQGSKPSLHNCPLLVPGRNAASAHLLQTLCTRFWNFTPAIEEYTCDPKELFEQKNPFLLIGDVCLEHSHQKTHSSLDIAQVWNMATGKSFIFAVIATHNDTFRTSPEEVIGFHRLLEDSYMWSQTHREAFLQQAADKVHCSPEFISDYYDTIEYRLTSKHFHGLDYFSELRAKHT